MSRPPLHVLLAGLTICACDAPSSTRSAPVEVEERKDEPRTPDEPTPVLLPPEAKLRVAETVNTPHTKQPVWTDQDDDCQDTRTEVLIARATGDVKFAGSGKCRVVAGSWDNFFSHIPLKRSRKVGVDLIVPYQNALESGASKWTPEEQVEFVNDMANLVVADVGSIAERGDFGPHVWLPLRKSSRCDYLEMWVDTKSRWNLSVTQDEAVALSIGLGKCRAGEEPELPGILKYERPPQEQKRPPQEQKSCCKYCGEGQACGNGCISASKVCTKPPGCACNR